MNIVYLQHSEYVSVMIIPLICVITEVLPVVEFVLEEGIRYDCGFNGTTMFMDKMMHVVMMKQRNY